jgi:uncharacterized membrane protein (UPF0127 family)
MRILCLLLFLPFAALSGCGAAAPNPILRTEHITVGSATGPHDFTVEVADNDDTRERGLMFRTQMAPNAGMLFDFKTPQQTQFWMENTVLPLDMLFVRADGVIANIRANAVPYSRESIPSAGPVLLVIEINGGRAAQLGIRAGDQVRAPELARR